MQGDIIPLSLIPDHWLLVSDTLQEGKYSEDDEGPLHALDAALTLLKNLYYLDDEKWRSVRDKVTIGLVKDTKDYGNTSVSMGAAALQKGQQVGFLNCGTGGIKYQLYARESGCLRLVSEYKPKGGANINSLKIGNYQPKVEVSLELTKEKLEQELAHADLPWKDLPDITICAFVTGTIRQHWEEADAEEKVSSNVKSCVQFVVVVVVILRWHYTKTSTLSSN